MLVVGIYCNYNVTDAGGGMVLENGHDACWYNLVYVQNAYPSISAWKHRKTVDGREQTYRDSNFILYPAPHESVACSIK